jgi:predicted glycosyltransferase
MKLLFDICHPAHFHLFKHVITEMKKAGHEVEIVARQKDCLLDLLEQAKLEHHKVSRRGKGLVESVWQAMKALKLVFLLTRAKRPDFMVGTSVVIGPVARLTGATSIVFNEDDAKQVPMFAKVAYPFAHYVVTPDCLKFENYGKKHFTYPGYHELAYLHPKRFTPNPAIREELGVGPGEKYFLVRLVSLTAYHDVGESGLSTEQAKAVIEHLSRHGRVFISAEGGVESDIRDYILPTSVDKILDVMAFADIVVGDSQTMVAEAAVLGTPALRCNTFVGRLTYLELTVGVLPKDFEKLMAVLEEWVTKSDIKEQWQRKRELMLDECVDLTDWIMNLLRNFAGGA